MPEMVVKGDGRRNFLPAWLWLGVAPAILPALYLLRYSNPDFYLRWVEGELGFIEILTPVLLAPAIICGVLVLRYRKVFPAPWIAVWFLLHAVGAFYFAGEELSWGQHLYGWKTPAALHELNDQDETNLHNMSSWLDQKPRVALVLWAVIGGCITPVLIAFGRVKIGGPEHWRYWVLPPQACVPAGLITGIVRIPEDVLFSLHMTPPFPFDVRASELQELFLTMFLSFYLISVYRRARALSSGM